MDKDTDLSTLLNLVGARPHRWMLTFDYDRQVELEYFGNDYSGDLESGAGDWSTRGALSDVVCKATTFVQLLQLIDGW